MDSSTDSFLGLSFNFAASSQFIMNDGNLLIIKYRMHRLPLIHFFKFD